MDGLGLHWVKTANPPVHGCTPAWIGLRWFCHMIDQTVKQIEERLRSLSALPEERKTELFSLLKNLKMEIAALEHSRSSESEALAASLTTSLAATAKPGPVSSADHLRSSVHGFEDSHPRLVQLVNSLSTLLASLGL